MVSSPMKQLGKTNFYWAGKGFMFKGLWYCKGGNKRIIPLNKFDNWTGKH